MNIIKRLFNRPSKFVWVCGGKVYYNEDRFNSLFDAIVAYLMLPKNYKNLEEEALKMIKKCDSVYGKYDTLQCVRSLVACVKFIHNRESDKLSYQ